MKEDMVPVYEFPEGHQIFRLTSKPMFQQFIGAPDMPDEVAGFLLVNARERPVSAMWMHTGEGKLTGEIKPPIGGSKMRWPRKMPWAPYWRDFVEQTMSEDYADANFALPIVVPDGLEQALNRPEDEAEHQRLQAHYDQAAPGAWMARERAVRDHMFALLQQIFDPLGPFREHIRVSRVTWGTPLGGPHRASIEHIRIQMLQTPGDELRAFQVEFSDDFLGWRLREEQPRARRRAFDAEGRTLLEAWQKLAEESAKDLRPFIPQSQLDAWWHSQRVEGDPVYDLEPYFLLNTTSPMLFDNPSFIAWAEQQAGA